MKKITFSLLMLFMVVGSAFGQCVNTTQFGSTTADNSGAVQTMTTCLFEQEWRGATGLIIGSDYEFTTTAGYITITDDSNNVLVHGTSPVTVSAVTVTSLRAHINTDAACGTATNCRTVTLQNLTPPSPPANDLCAGAIEITSSGVVAGTTLVATNAGEASCGTSNTAPDVWYFFDDLSGTGFDVDLDLCNGSTGYDSKLSVYSGACGGLTCVTGNDDFCGLQSGVSFTTDGSSRYYVLVHGFGTASGDFELNVQGIIVGAPPVISCPMDITASNDPGACGAVVNFADAIAIDAEDGVITATQTAGIPSGDEFPIGVSTVEFTATDSDSNSVTCTFTVTVTDDEDPMLACQDITVELDAAGNYTLLPGEALASSSDNCPGETVEFLVAGGGGGGTSTLTTTFANNNGASGNMFDLVALNDLVINSFDVNLDSGSSDMEVYFKTGPYLPSVNTAADWTLVGSVAGLVSAGPGVATPLGLSLGINVAAGETVAFYVTSTTSTINYTNGSGTGALFASDANLEFYEGAGNTYPFLNNFNPRVFNGNIIYEVPALVPAPSIAFDCSNVGVNPVTVQITDASGNTATCTANVTVEDNTAPVIACIGSPGNLSESEDFEGTTIPTGWTSDIAVGAQDWTFGSGDLPTGDDFPTFAAIFDDDIAGSGNTNVGTLSSPVYDLSSAVSANVSYEVAFQEAGDQEFSVEVWDGAAWQQIAFYDEDLDPDIQAESFDVTAFMNAAFQVRFAYDDLGGWGWHAAIDNFVVDYEEVSTPLDVTLDANGMATIDTSDLLFTVDEACGWTATTGGASSNTLETTFAGGNGFNGNMFDIVAINDITVNSFDVNLAAGVVDDVEVWFKTGTHVGSETDPTAWTLLGSVNVTSAGDGLPTPLGLSLGQDVTAGDTVAFYVTTITAGATMNYTNGTTPGAVFASDANIEFLEGAGGGYPFNVTFTPRVFNGNIIYDASTLSTTIDLDCSNLGENQFEVTVTDDSGNTATCVATVNVIDDTAPILVCADATIELGEDGTAVVDPEALLAQMPGTFEVITISSDNQSGAVGNTDFTVAVTADETVSFDWDYSTDDGAAFDQFGYLVNGVYTQLTDSAGGNTQSGNATVTLVTGDVFGFRSSSEDGLFGASTTVISNFMPGFTGQFEPANWTLDLDNSDGDAFFVEIPGGPLSFDACGITVLAVDVTEVTCADIGTPITVTVFASDASGNIAACTATVTVVDALGPVITCPADQTVDPGEGNLFYEVPDYFATGEATVTDNCTDPVTITSQDPAVGELISDGVYTVTLTAEDEYGNVGECTFELTVESILGLDDNKLDSSISMYPNPAQSNVTISNSSNILLDKAAIYDTNGRLISTTDLSDMQQEKTIDVSNLATGVYMVQIQGENATAVKRLVKE